MVGISFRFVAVSPFWLDEALSANIADLTVGEIPRTLRGDGHPPLYYLLLHYWMRLAGTSDASLRALSGFWSVALLPLTWVAARRVGGRRAALSATVLLALSPYAVRYATEARMYAMFATLAMLAWLAADSAWHRPDLVRLGGLATCTGLLLWTHYWALWFVSCGASFLVVTRWRARHLEDGRTVRVVHRLLAAIGVGILSFVPWLPTLWYQRAHTGTPWARASRPAEMLHVFANELGGNGTGEAMVLGGLTLALAAAGLWLRSTDRWAVTLDLRQVRNPAAASMAVLAGGTLALGCATGLATGTAFAPRYAAVVLPFVVILAGLTVSELRPRAMALALLTVVVPLSALGVLRNATAVRTDAGENAQAILSSAAPGDLVVYCPDQTGPATARILGPSVDQVTYPRFADPRFVDWVDYQTRATAVAPEVFANEVLARAEGRTVFLVYSVAIHSHREICPAVYEELGRARPGEVLTTASEAYDAAGVVRFPPAP